MADIVLPEIDIVAGEGLDLNAIRFAWTQEGQQEDPRGSNRGPMVNVYLNFVGLDATKGNYAWCAAYVSYCIGTPAAALGITPEFQFSAGAMALIHKNPKLIIASPIFPCVGVINHGNGEGHAFFVHKQNDDGTVGTLEGNSNNDGSREGYIVVARNRQLSEITGGLIKIA